MPSKKLGTAVAITYTKQLVDFIVTTVRLPHPILAELIVAIDDADLRKEVTVVICYHYFHSVHEGVPFDCGVGQLPTPSNEALSNFLATILLIRTKAIEDIFHV